MHHLGRNQNIHGAALLRPFDDDSSSNITTRPTPAPAYNDNIAVDVDRVVALSICRTAVPNKGNPRNEHAMQRTRTDEKCYCPLRRKRSRWMFEPMAVIGKCYISGYAPDLEKIQRKTTYPIDAVLERVHLETSACLPRRSNQT